MIVRDETVFNDLVEPLHDAQDAGQSQSDRLLVVKAFMTG
jgi:hypothetical protein